MIKELNLYLDGEMSDDYWYDEAISICEDILKQFSKAEWNELLELIPSNDNVWNLRLVECLGNINQPYDLSCILKMINTDNYDVFTVCIDSLREVDLSLIPQNEKELIRDRIMHKIEVSSLPVQKMYESFLKKLQE